MIQLLYAFLAVAIFALFINAGISHVDLVEYGSKRTQAQVSTAMLTLSEGWSNYYAIYGRYPVNLTEASGVLGGVSLPAGFAISGLTSGFAGWCMDVTMNEKEWRAISHLMRDYSSNYGVSATCGYLGGFDPDWSAVNSGSMYPKNAVLTYYFSR